MDQQKQRKKKPKSYDAALCVRTERAMHESFMGICREARVDAADTVRLLMSAVVNGQSGQVEAQIERLVAARRAQGHDLGKGAGDGALN